MHLLGSSPAFAEDYSHLKEEILAQCGLSPCQALAAFHQWTYQPGLTPRNQMEMDTLLRITKCCLQPELHSATQVTEKVTLDWFLRSLPPSPNAWLSG